ncbi:MAG TPA: hypothetical protein VLM79_16060 [Kofleriaceae bacterium]|nr:hypothetical protein [Kofleriaceae bacterium]
MARNRRRQRARRFAARDELASDPRDPVQTFDDVSELQVVPLDVDALSTADVEAAQDLALLESELDDPAAAFADTTDEVIELDHPIRRDGGDLYGAHTPAAVDRVHPDDDRAFKEGQNWIEALETSAIENGAEPERPLDDIIDDEEVLQPPHASDKRDRPVADLGSGGRRGL